MYSSCTCTLEQKPHFNTTCFFYLYLLLNNRFFFCISVLIPLYNYSTLKRSTDLSFDVSKSFFLSFLLSFFKTTAWVVPAGLLLGIKLNVQRIFTLKKKNIKLNKRWKLCFSPNKLLKCLWQIYEFCSVQLLQLSESIELIIYILWKYSWRPLVNALASFQCCFMLLCVCWLHWKFILIRFFF